ncbi:MULTISPECIES: hypothetical protein [Marinomonas]|uniref:Glycosyl transferase family 2 n=1 Tax=Marinomonas rhodophyticola TaxID=2992803 RepID=A0ABT3KKG5_9GAMM|nr:hypothetical protein [Marinomonas sp. KJ51-3]MCW4631033.1 hypothetical protein [Marinomonas sp. KJ51-3]
MIEVVSLVNFDNKKRVQYLEKSFASFHKFNPIDVRHIVFDSSKDITEQKVFYDKHNIELYHLPNCSYIDRLKHINDVVKNDYFIFLPDDFVWIFDYPIEKAIEAARHSNVMQIKLSCRGMQWFSEKNPEPMSWYDDNKLISGELLVKEGKCYVSKRWWYRNFHEQFSLAATITNGKFLNETIRAIPSGINSPGAVEKKAYIKLLFKPYYTGYYDMLIPAFHFCDSDVEGKAKEYTTKDMLIENNYEIYNSLFNDRG